MVGTAKLFRCVADRKLASYQPKSPPSPRRPLTLGPAPPPRPFMTIIIVATKICDTRKSLRETTHGKVYYRSAAISLTDVFWQYRGLGATFLQQFDVER
ncbi:hypothetical protein EVAR_50623_1 [Eumeta japonica]|uniref:Uncharacterized protein n=1 Tax=Eumeta variegata TaxID=151549 RepID=A0A4C1XJW8_EUMVA|nr:hypothetical protein EVAR_50623_1 [Eumeta japonica]